MTHPQISCCMWKRRFDTDAFASHSPGPGTTGWPTTGSCAWGPWESPRDLSGVECPGMLLGTTPRGWRIIWLVVSNMNGLFSMIYEMSSQPHWRTHIFQDGYCTTKQIMITMHRRTLGHPWNFVKNPVDFPEDSRTLEKGELHILEDHGNECDIELRSGGLEES